MKRERKNTHIVHIIDSLEAVGGAERMVFELATRLPNEEFSTEVVTFFGDPSNYFYTQLENAGVRVTVIPKKSKIGFGLFHDLSYFLRKVKPEIVHTHLFAADVWGGLAARKAGVKTIVSTEHNINKNEGRVKHFMKSYTNYSRTAIIAISEAVKQYIIQYSPDSENKVTVIPNGINIEQFWYTRKKVELSNQPVQIALVGRLEEQKGHADLLAALPHVKGNYHLKIVGDGILRQELEKQVEQLGLTDTVMFTGVQTDIAAVYTKADIVVVPSRYEGFGLAAVEAMASGCAVMASKIDGLKEVVVHDQTGMLVNMQQPQEVAKILDALIADPERRHALGVAAQKKVHEHYSIDILINRYRELYQSLS